MESVLKFNSFLSGSYNKLQQNKKDMTLVAVLIYTLLFAVCYLLFLMPCIFETGSLLSSDGVAQYYPAVTAFRKSLLGFFDSVASGNPVLPMMDFDYMYGSDNFAGALSFCYHFFPFYLFSVFVEESALTEFIAVGIIILLYLVGLSFINFCRHYKMNLLMGSFIAIFYVFCGNAFFTAIWNPQFLVMLILLPFFIIGMDEIIQKNRSVKFILSTAWLVISGGFTFCVYVFPFVALFAMIRIGYAKKGNYFINLFKYFIIGVLHISAGVIISGIVFLPGLYQFINGGRSMAELNVTVQYLFTPSVSNLTEFLSAEASNREVSLCGALIPTLLYTLFSYKAKSEYKLYTLVIMACVAMPVIWYGLNGFSYSICRWGFIPAFLACFLSVRQIPEMLAMDKKEIKQYFIFSGVLLIGFMSGINEIAIIPTAVVSIISFIKPLEEKLWNICCKACGAVKNTVIKVKESKFRILRLPVYIILAVGVIMLVTLDIGFNLFKVYPSLIAALVISYAVILLSYFKTDLRTVSAVSLSVLYICPAVLYYMTNTYTLNLIQPVEEYKELAELGGEADMFNRYANVFNESDSFEILSDEKIEEIKKDREDKLAGDSDDEPESEYSEDTALNSSADSKTTAAANNSDIETERYNQIRKIFKISIMDDPQINLTHRYGLRNAAAFQSVIDGDLTNFFARCGQDIFSYSSKVDYAGFSRKEVIASLLGVNYLYNYSDFDNYFGTEAFETDNPMLMFFKFKRNNYALPVGVTYDTCATKEQFEAFNPAELPYAMMNTAYLEGYNNDSFDNSDKVFSKDCDFDLNKKKFMTSVYGIDICNNEIKLNTDTKGCFVYMSFSDVDYKTASYSYSVDTLFLIDDKVGVTSRFESQNWPWRRSVHEYTISLGYWEENIEKISFLSMFAYNADKLKITAVPADVYTEAYEARTQETLKNVVMADNRITGDITVSTDKILSVGVIHSDGWKVYVDDTEQPLYKLNGLFLGVPLKAGSHTVRFEYVTPWLREGAVCSAAGIVILIIYIAYFKRREKKKADKTE